METSLFWWLLFGLLAAVLPLLAHLTAVGPQFERRGALGQVIIAGVAVTWFSSRGHFAGPESRWMLSAVATAAMINLAIALWCAVVFSIATQWTRRSNVPRHLQLIAAPYFRGTAHRLLLRVTTLIALVLLTIHFFQPELRSSGSVAAVSLLPLIGTPILLPTTIAAIQRVRFAATPYDSADAPYDIFISYKSEDVHVVRRVVDRLLAQGFRVWFAEYTILFHARDRFQDAINQGISQSQFGVIFSNDRYIRSKYVRRELRRMLDPAQGMGPDKVVEVRIPQEPGTRTRFGQQMNSVRWLEYKGNIDEVVDFIVQNAGVRHTETTVIRSAPHRKATGTFEGAKFSFTVPASWREIADSRIEMGKQLGGTWKDDIETPRYYAPDTDPSRSFHIVVGYDSPAISPSIESLANEPVDDRKQYEDMRDFAMLWLAKNHKECKGLHLFFLRGVSHMLITYFDCMWNRRYSIVLKHPHNGRDVEFAMVFWCGGKFRDYCRCTSEMEDIAESLQWDSVSS